MAKIQKELLTHKDSDLIWGRNFIAFPSVATKNNFSHKSATRDFWKRFKDDPYIGVWHETYEVDPKKSENIYYGMIFFGFPHSIH